MTTTSASFIPARHRATSAHRSAITVLRDGAGRVPALGVLLPLAVGIAYRASGHDSGFGPFSTGLTGGAMAYIALLLVCIGAQMTPASLRPVAGRVGVVLAGTALVPGAAAAVYAACCGRAGLGGVSALAVATAAVSSSTVLWVALGKRHGSPADQWGGAVASTLNSCPLLPMLVLLAAGGASRTAPHPATVLDVLLPLAAGAAIGTCAPGLRTVLKQTAPVLTAGLSLALGAQMPIRHLGAQLVPGAVLGLCVALVSGGLVAAGWRLVLRRPAAVGFAAAGCTVSMPLTPVVVASADASWAPLVPAATAQLSIAVLVSTIAAPLLTALASRRRPRHSPAAVSAHPRRPVERAPHTGLREAWPSAARTSRYPAVLHATIGRPARLAALAGAVLTLLLAAGAHRPATTVPGPPPDPRPPTPPLQPAAVTRAQPVRGAAAGAAPTGPRDTVGPRDCLWTIEATRTGNPTNWPRIWRASGNRPTGTGARLTSPALLAVGQNPLLPDGTVGARAATSRDTPHQPTPGHTAGPTPRTGDTATPPPRATTRTAGGPTHRRWPTSGGRALLASGVSVVLGLAAVLVALAILRHLRRRRPHGVPAPARRGRPGASIPHPTPAVTPGQVGTAVRHVADPVRARPHPADPSARPASDRAAAGSVPGTRAAADHRPRVRLTTLGQVQLVVDGRPVALGRTSRPTDLLALLAAHPDGVRAERAVDVLFTDEPASTGRAHLRKVVYQIRSAIRRATGRPDEFVLTTPDGRIRLDPDRIDVDLWTILDALHTAEHRDDPAARAEAGRTVAERYTDPFAPTATAEWVEGFRYDLRDRVVTALTRHVDELLEIGHTDRAQTTLARAAAIDAHNELLAVRLMRLQAADGHPDAAARTLDQLRRRLAEIDALPSPDVLAAARRIIGTATIPDRGDT